MTEFFAKLKLKVLDARLWWNDLTDEQQYYFILGGVLAVGLLLGAVMF